MLDKVERMAWLYDFYAPLLTLRQQRLVDLYYHQNLSLQEIAEGDNVSRQAVYDILRRTERIMEDYEQKLGLVAAYRIRVERLRQVQQLLNEKDALAATDKATVNTLIEQLLEND